MSLYQDDEYAIGLTPTTLAPLRLLGVAVPDQIVWRDAAIYYVRGDNSRVGDGLPSWEWVWDVISISRLSSLLSLLAGQESAWVYAHTNQRTGVYPNAAAEFHIYKALMYKPILAGQEGVSIARAAISMQTVKLSFVNAVDQAGAGYL
jgi:hypothetical protein